jgi:hypothetical protein
MSRDIVSAALPRRGFLRQLCQLPLIGGGVTLLGAPTAVAEPVTPDLVAAYRRWLTLEHYLLLEECPAPPTPHLSPRSSMMAGLDDASVSQIGAAIALEYLGAEQHIKRVHAEFRAKCCNFRMRSGFTEDDPSLVDRFYLSPDRAIVSPPASTRAALVMAAVGCDWRALC